MLDIKFIREFPELVRDAIAKKHLNLNLNELLALDSSIAAKKRETEDFQAEANRVAKEIPKASPETRGDLILRGKDSKAALTTLEPELRELEAQLKTLMYAVPQIPWEGAPVGPDEHSNLPG